MKSLIGVLSLVIVLVYSQAEESGGCDKTLGPEELHQVDGDWMMVWLNYDKTRTYDEPMSNLTSSYMEIRIQPDNRTLVVERHYKYRGGINVFYKYNLTLPQSHEGHHRLDVVAIGGEDDSVTVEFFLTSEGSMVMLYKGEKYGSDLTIYSREGQQIDNLEKAHEEYRALAKCLNFHNFMEWQCDKSDFCHKKSVLPTLDLHELHQVEGYWVLVWMAFDKTKDADYPITNFTSSHMEVQVQADSHTVVLHERNMIGGECMSFKGNLVFDQKSKRINRFNLEDGKEIVNGEEKLYNDIATAEFFPSSENTMEMLFKSDNHGSFLLMYRKEGHHLDHLDKDHKKYKEKAEYLGMSGNDFGEWHYDGEADFCHRKSVLPTLDSEHLRQVDGDWVLVWTGFDKTREQDFPVTDFTSSHVEARVQPDSHTVFMLERNMMGGKCVSYQANLVLPQNSKKIHRLILENGKEITEVGEKQYSDTGNVQFFPSSENTMEMFHSSGRFGPYLLIYRREGHHQNMKDVEEHYEEYKEKAKSLGLSGKNFKEWSYNGVADFCPKTPAPES